MKKAPFSWKKVPDTFFPPLGGVMRKILIIAGLLSCLLLTTIFAQPRISKEDEIIKKLDKILENQELMFDYLKFIKNRSR